ncbi:MAG: PadR family transcriptional regulator [Candidatus Bathyarchaeia archaeon]
MAQRDTHSLVRFSVSREIRDKFCKTFLDLIVVLMLLRDGPMTGYKLLSHIYEAFGVLVAPSVLYPTLHLMEKRGLIKGDTMTNRSRVFSVTEKGKSWARERMTALIRLLVDLERRVDSAP